MRTIRLGSKRKRKEPSANCSIASRPSLKKRYLENTIDLPDLVLFAHWLETCLLGKKIKVEALWLSRPRPGFAPPALYSTQLPLLIFHKAALGSTSTCTYQHRYLAARPDRIEPESPSVRFLFLGLSLWTPLYGRFVRQCALKPVRGCGIGLITSSKLIIFKTWWLC